MSADYFRLSGGGNDFLAVVEPAEEPAGQQIRAWCRRGVSLGADGLFILRRIGSGVQMRYFNADGEPAALCVNATRCAARLAFHLGWAEQDLLILTGAGTLKARRADGARIELEAPLPEESPRRVSVIEAEEGAEAMRVVVGVPHLVLWWLAGLESAPVRDLGPTLRSHGSFAPHGVNVDFVRRTSRHDIEIRTYERGVEAETLACGSGVLAAVICGLSRGTLELPVTATTAGGFSFLVRGEWDDAARRLFSWTLTGDARLLAAGTSLPGADQVPEPPSWS
jgi:diaminopimelate epimerase